MGLNVAPREGKRDLGAFLLGAFILIGISKFSFL